jgi:hypothetical protein
MSSTLTVGEIISGFTFVANVLMVIFIGMQTSNIKEKTVTVRETQWWQTKLYVRPLKQD